MKALRQDVKGLTNVMQESMSALQEVLALTLGNITLVQTASRGILDNTYAVCKLTAWAGGQFPDMCTDTKF